MNRRKLLAGATNNRIREYASCQICFPTRLGIEGVGALVLPSHRAGCYLHIYSLFPNTIVPFPSLKFHIRRYPPNFEDFCRAQTYREPWLNFDTLVFAAMPSLTGVGWDWFLLDFTAAQYDTVSARGKVASVSRHKVSKAEQHQYLINAEPKPPLELSEHMPGRGPKKTTTGDAGAGRPLHMLQGTNPVSARARSTVIPWNVMFRSTPEHCAMVALTMSW